MFRPCCCSTSSILLACVCGTHPHSHHPATQTYFFSVSNHHHNTDSCSNAIMVPLSRGCYLCSGHLLCARCVILSEKKGMWLWFKEIGRAWLQSSFFSTLESHDSFSDLQQVFFPLWLSCSQWHNDRYFSLFTAFLLFPHVYLYLLHYHCEKRREKVRQKIWYFKTASGAIGL